MATRGRTALIHWREKMPEKKAKANSAASIQASHFTFKGRIPISSTCRSGYRVAKAKNMDMLM